MRPISNGTSLPPADYLELRAPVECVGFLRLPLHRRALFAECHYLHSPLIHAQRREISLGFRRASETQSEVVFVGALRIGMTDDSDTHVGMPQNHRRLRFHRR